MKLDLSKIKLSKSDLKRKIIFPKQISKDLAEFIGIIIGDGYIYHKTNHYVIGIVGSPKTDAGYFLKIQKLIFNLFNLQAKFKKRERGLRLVFNSKGIFYFLTKTLNLPYGKGKGSQIQIPKEFCQNKEFVSHTLRGIFDTDGTIFTSNKKGVPLYPCIELTTTSLNLAEQVKKLLIKKGFRVAGVRKYKYKHSKLISNKVSLYGQNNMTQWSQNIGFSNPIKEKKLKIILQKPKTI